MCAEEVADEGKSLEIELFAQVTDDLLNSGMIDTIACPDVVRNGPARDLYDRNDNLHVLQLAVTAMTMLGEVGGGLAFEVGACDVVEDQFRLEAKEISQAVVKGHFDPIFGRVELVKGPVPSFELLRVNSDSATLVPWGIIRRP
jgi:hypothetical protein